MEGMRVDYDSPWKEALEQYFNAFMAFFFPQAYDGIDWSRGYNFLDKELQKIYGEGKKGRKYVDKLVGVWRKDGAEALVMVHVEVQGQVEAVFNERMYQYNYRIFDKYKRQVVSLAILADEQRGWRPHGFGYELWGCRVSLEFPVVKLLDYEAQWNRLEESMNPFAVVVMAHLKSQATRRDPEGRSRWKLHLVKMLYQRGYTKDDIIKLFSYIDRMMKLPKYLTEGFLEEIEQLEEDKGMPYITSVERLGHQRGFLQKAREAVIEVLETRLGKVPESIIENVNKLDDLNILNALLKKAATVVSLDEFSKHMITL